MASPQPTSSGAAVALGVATALNSVPQPIQDQDGNGSSLEIGTNTVVISGKANLGIGIGTPQVPLHVGTSCSARFELGDETQMVSLGAPGAFNIDKIGVTAGRFTVTNGGLVGINQPNPAYNLDVNGTIHGTGLVVNGLGATTSAPNPKNLCSLFYDPTSGCFYYQE